MRIVYHLGLHCTDEDLIRKALGRDGVALAGAGVAVPAPQRYREVVRKTMTQLRGAPAPQDTSDALIDAIVEHDSVDRLVLSNENFICLIPRVMENGVWYALADQRVQAYANLFPSAGIEFFVALRNPATLVPALATRATDRDFHELTFGNDVRTYRWAELIHRIRAAVPGAGLTVWCNEDTPLIWSRLLHEMAGIDASVRLTGEMDLLREIMTREGADRLEAYLAERPNLGDAQRTKAIGLFLEKFARDDALEEEIDLPGWDDALVDELTAIYDADIAEVSAIPGVRFLAP